MIADCREWYPSAVNLPCKQFAHNQGNGVLANTVSPCRIGELHKHLPHVNAGGWTSRGTATLVEDHSQMT